MRLSRRLRRLLEQATSTPKGAVAVEDMLASFVADAAAAEKFYEKFHWGNMPATLDTAAAPTVREGDILVKLGTLEQVTYNASKGGENADYFHDFKRKKPVLAVTPQQKLVIVGGSYRVTRRGIVG